MRLIYELCRTQGLSWVVYRVRNDLEHRLGVIERRLPVAAWSDIALEDLVQSEFKSAAATEPASLFRQHAGRFLFEPGRSPAYAQALSQMDRQTPTDWQAKVDAIASGRLTYFFGPVFETGFPPNWNDNLPMNLPGPARLHFADIDEFSSGDVKCIWEPSRFAFAYDLARAYWRTGDQRPAELFWQAADDWLEQNPPNVGINWKCGQESTFRLMAWCFAIWSFVQCPSTTNDRLTQFLRFVYVTAKRVEKHINYALSQNNNHGISEAMGLFIIGLLFPFFADSDKWRRTGQRFLEEQALKLIYDDGAFSQHSVNYHRVMLHDYLFAIRIGQLNGNPLSRSLLDRVAKAGRLLHAMQDQVSGGVPRYGQDDGAQIWPVSNQDYDDFRPVVQATAAVCTDQPLPWPHGPWDEEALWLCGISVLDRPVSKEKTGDLSASDGGCYVLRMDHGMVFTRAQQFKHRPAQLDQLHVDVWWHGINVALDPGTYSYNAQEQWAGMPFARTAAHNTVMPASQEQAHAVSRFLMLPLPHASAAPIFTSKSGSVCVLDLTGPDKRLIRRVVRLGGEHVLVLDTLALPADSEPSTIHWHFTDAPHRFDTRSGRLELELPPGRYTAVVGSLQGLALELERAVPGSAIGWFAPRYTLVRPALWLTGATAPGPAKLFTLLGPGNVQATTDGQTLRLAINDKLATINASDWPGQQPADALANSLDTFMEA